MTIVELEEIDSNSKSVLRVNEYINSGKGDADKYKDEYFLFGTDAYGRDSFVRVFEGGWISLQVGVLSTLMSIVIGVFFGSIAGFFSGKIDSIIMRFIEIISSFPFLAIAFTVASIYRDKPETTRLFYTILLLGFIRWTGLARMVRGQILSLREQEFMK